MNVTIGWQVTGEGLPLNRWGLAWGEITSAGAASDIGRRLEMPEFVCAMCFRTVQALCRLRHKRHQRKEP